MTLQKPKQNPASPWISLMPYLANPQLLHKVLKEKGWRNAMYHEFDAKQRNHTWDLVTPVPQQNIVGCKSVFKLKHLPSGVLECHKDRPIAKGLNKKYGVN